MQQNDWGDVVPMLHVLKEFFVTQIAMDGCSIHQSGISLLGESVFFTFSKSHWHQHSHAFLNCPATLNCPCSGILGIMSKSLRYSFSKTPDYSSGVYQK